MTPGLGFEPRPHWCDYHCAIPAPQNSSWCVKHFGLSPSSRTRNVKQTSYYWTGRP